jgi:hypothetical protein
MGLETVEIVMDMEDRFQIHIPDAAASNCYTVADLQNIIVDLLAAKGKTPDDQLRQEVWDGMMKVLARNRYPVERIRPDSKWIGDITKYG